VALQSIGEYEISELLGSGTVGDAYRAKHRETGQAVVVKLLQNHAAGEPDIQRRFVREVSIAEKLNHPNIVRHFDCGLADDQIFFAMELVEGGTLKDVLRHLSKNGTVGFVMDQYSGPPVGVRVPVFGVPVGTPAVIATLAKRTGAVVLPAVNYRLPDGRFVTEIRGRPCTSSIGITGIYVRRSRATASRWATA